MSPRKPGVKVPSRPSRLVQLLDLMEDTRPMRLGIEDDGCFALGYCTACSSSAALPIDRLCLPALYQVTSGRGMAQGPWTRAAEAERVRRQVRRPPSRQAVWFCC